MNSQFGSSIRHRRPSPLNPSTNALQTHAVMGHLNGVEQFVLSALSTEGGLPLLDATTNDDPVLSSLFFVGLLSTTLALGILKLTAYSQLEIVRTAMLSRHVKNGGAKVLQLGGTTRDLFYYPAKTLSVSVNLPDGGTRTQGLFEQAGIQVGIPTTATSVSLDECLASMPSASLDTVVAFEQFGEVTSAKSLASIANEISRILKPGGTFIFYERIARDGGFAQVGGRRGSLLDVGGVIAGLDVWDFCEYDTAAGGLDRHDVGVAINGMREGVGGMEGSVDSSAFEALVRKNRKAKKKT
jgi:hypothetical protein